MYAMDSVLLTLSQMNRLNAVHVRSVRRIFKVTSSYYHRLLNPADAEYSNEYLASQVLPFLLAELFLPPNVTPIAAYLDTFFNTAILSSWKLLLCPRAPSRSQQSWPGGILHGRSCQQDRLSPFGLGAHSHGYSQFIFCYPPRKF